MLLLGLLRSGEADFLAHLAIAFALRDLLERDGKAALMDVPAGLTRLGNGEQSQPRESRKLRGQQNDQQVSEQPHSQRL